MVYPIPVDFVFGGMLLAEITIVLNLEDHRGAQAAAFLILDRKPSGENFLQHLQTFQHGHTLDVAAVVAYDVFQ